MSILEKKRSDLLKVGGLRSGYGRIPILNGIDLAVGNGEFVGVLGHNGMGKTTFLRTVMGHIKSTAGSVEFDGKVVTHWKPEKRARAGLGYVPQGRQIFATLSVFENLKIASLRSGLNVERQIESVLEIFPRLKRLLDRQGGVLSGGEQQLLALARCLATSPKLILLDEPTEGIQPSIVEEIQERLSEIKKKNGVTFVLVEQNLDFIQSLSDRILILQKGRIIRELTSDEMAQSGLESEFAGLATN